MAKRQPTHLRDALGELLAAGQLSTPVRPEIAASWNRCIASDLHPDRFEVPYDPEGGESDRLTAAAQPVLSRLSNDVASMSISVLLADKQGHVVDRAVGDRTLRSQLDAIMLAPGFLYRESRIGTNAIGTTLAEGTPSIVVGSEHFADALTTMACAAAPIVDPTTGSILGALDLTCTEREAHVLMLALAKHAAREIEDQLVRRNPEADRLLLECFVRARRHTRGPLVGLSSQAFYTNTRASKIVRGQDREALWQLVAAGLRNHSNAVLEVPVALEGWRTAACEAILDGGALVGALLRFEPRPAPDNGADSADGRRKYATFGWESLNSNERSVVELIADGLSNREAAARLFLSRHTVDFHLRQIYQKLAIGSRVELARIVIERGHLAT